MKKKKLSRSICRAWFHEKNKKGDAAISAGAEKNKKEDAGLENIGDGLITPRSQLGFGTVPRARQGKRGEGMVTERTMVLYDKEPRHSKGNIMEVLEQTHGKDSASKPQTERTSKQ